MSYQFFFNFFCPHPIGSFLWIQYNQIVFATSTSLGAVYWSLFAVRKYETYANFEMAVKEAYDKILGAMEQFDNIVKLFRNKGLLDLVMDTGKAKGIPKVDPKQVLEKLNQGKIIK